MNLYLTTPLMIAIVALFLADEKGKIFIGAVRRTIAVEDKTRVRARLVELGKGSERDYENFRIYQMVLVSLGTSILLGFSILGFISILMAGVTLAFMIPTTIIATERGLSKRVQRRKEIIESEFPALIELLTLAIGAGESPSGAVKRISERAQGVLPAELRNVSRDVENGKSFTLALDNLSRRASSPVVRRFADSMAIAITRGTPLVETLTHTIRESRSTERIKLLNIAAKAEISMMIPVVFLILPISILFAMYPSMSSLDLFAS
jgi:tight adherence protein C